MRWILLTQEFDLEIRDKKGIENTVADHLSRLRESKFYDKGEIVDSFPDEHILSASSEIPWYADIVNYLVAGFIPDALDVNSQKKLKAKARKFVYDELYLYR